jgi:hypothetical protein
LINYFTFLKNVNISIVGVCTIVLQKIVDNRCGYPSK